MVQFKVRPRDGNGVGGDGDVRMFLKGNADHGICMWAKVMGQRGAHKRQREDVIMASFAGEAAGIGMIWSKRA